MGTPRTRLDYDARRGQILAAARRLFATHDYSTVSMRDIAEAAGVARGLLNHYFGSKHDLYLEVTREMFRLPPPPLIDDTTTKPSQIWACSVDRWLDLVETIRDPWLAAVRAGEAGHDPQLRHIIDEASEAVAERIIEVLGLSRDNASPELRAVVRAYGGMAQEATREWLERGRLNREQVRVLLVGAMPLIAEHLVPEVLAAGKPGRRTARNARR